MRQKRRFILTLWTLLLFVWTGRAEQEILLEKNWKFTRQDNVGNKEVVLDDSQWQTVRIPHDWAIYGPFSAQNDKQNVAIAQDGQQQAMEHAGRTGGLPFVGVGWYRTTFSLENYKEGQQIFLLFDGAMSHAEVYVNGEKAGFWPFGYNSFYFNVTPWVKKGVNLLAVRLENKPESSRWYPGAGLYRNVHLIVKEESYIPIWGAVVTTPKVSEERAAVHLNIPTVLPEDASPMDYHVVGTIKDATGALISSYDVMLTPWNQENVPIEMQVMQPHFWSPDDPYLYSVTVELRKGDQVFDRQDIPLGIRTLELKPGKGLFFNGKPFVFKGVCNHHDLGPLGAAVNEAAIRRQLRILKEMGCNAVRTSHNMPAPELIKACDEMGMMVMAESFDEWKYPKCQNGYNLYYDEWVEKDLINLVRHYRNNPSVVMWSIGNEVPEQHAEHAPRMARFMQDICHREDPTRLVTLGMDNPNAYLLAATLDVAGYNYRPHMYGTSYKKLPQEIILGAETASTVSSRGVYKFPVERKAMQKYEDHQSSSYDVEHCSWSNLPEDDFIMHEEYPYCIGEFVWTGFDYLGEPTPYYTDWPSHSSLFGIIDLAGIPKDRYYLYRSHWKRDAETLHILPHWNWKGKEGDTIPVFVYTNYPTAELFINGKSQGKRTKDLSVTYDNSSDPQSVKDLKRQKRYRLMWMETRYEPGTVKVVAYNEKGEAVAEKEMHTAGKPVAIRLTADRTQLRSDGKDLSFIKVELVDKDGNVCPDRTDEISFKVKGAGSYEAAANGNPASLESFQAPHMKLFSGALTAIVRSGEQPGKIVLEAKAKGMKKAEIEIITTAP